MMSRFFSFRFAALTAVLLFMASACQAGTWQITYSASGSTYSTTLGSRAWSINPSSVSFDNEGFLILPNDEDFSASTNSGGTVYAHVEWVPSYPGEIPPPHTIVQTSVAQGIVDTWEDNVYYAFASNGIYGGPTYVGHPEYGGAYTYQDWQTETLYEIPGEVGLFAEVPLYAEASADYGYVSTRLKYKIEVINL